MITQFTVSNFRSIKDRITLRTLKTGLRESSLLNANSVQVGKQDILKSIVLFGPNASGKSTVLRALKALEFLVMRSSNFKPNETIIAYEPFKLDVEAQESPVSFSLEFIQAGFQYEYTLSFSKQTIEVETLYYYPNGVQSLVFSRIKGHEIKFGEYYRGAKKTIEKLLLPNQLFLSKAAENAVEAVIKPFQFFSNSLRVFPFLDDYQQSNVSRLFAKRLAQQQNSRFSKLFNALICSLDTGIDAVVAKETDWSLMKLPESMSDEVKKQFQEQYRYSVKARHKLFKNGIEKGIVEFDLEEESTGTQSLFVIAGIILDALEQGKVLIVDEFEKNLHPGITSFLIKLFHNPVTNTKQAQLIFATHDITQLSGDTFRRDQVWFTEKNENGSTNLFRCSDIKGIRLGTPLDKWYASGKLGGTHVINELNFLLEMQQHEQEQTV